MLFHYCNLLIFKLKFHKKNEIIPGNLQLEDANLAELASNDINNYFQLCCEFFDYADEIVQFEDSIFVTMDRSRSNSMTESGQCKLAPLVLCIQESNQLYDFCVKFMFKLHDQLPGDVLEGHRDRFLAIFKHLKTFYQCCENLQYFKNLITIPNLPPNPPNFRVKADFNSYEKPMMKVVEPSISPTHDTASLRSGDDSESILVDFSDLNLSTSTSINHNNTNLNETIREEDVLQQQQQNEYMLYLNSEIERLRFELDNVLQTSEQQERQLRKQLKETKEELIETRSLLDQNFIKTEGLEEQIRIFNEQDKSRVAVETMEKKAVSSEEKFNKMKELYTKLKEQHVTLLRKEADVRKENALLTGTSTHADNIKKELEIQVNQASEEKQILDEQLKLKINELNDLKGQNEKLIRDSLINNQKYEEENGQLKDKIDNLVNECFNSKQQLELNRIKMTQTILFGFLKQCEKLIQNSHKTFNDPILLNCKSGAEYLLTILQPFHDDFQQLLTNYQQFRQEFNESPSTTNDSTSINNKTLALMNSLTLFTNYIHDTIVTGKITSFTAANLAQGEDLADLCEKTGQLALNLFNSMMIWSENLTETNEIEDNILKIMNILTDLVPKIHDIGDKEIGDLIDQEMATTTEAIESAVSKLQELVNKSRGQETGIKLEVNDKILDSCQDLMKSIKILIVRAKELQREIVAQGRVINFYSFLLSELNCSS
jgi:huntingtin interacting protein 1